jgi:hypothetical protein
MVRVVTMNKAAQKTNNNDMAILGRPFAAAEPASSPTASIAGHTTSANNNPHGASLAVTMVLPTMFFTEIPESKG